MAKKKDTTPETEQKKAKTAKITAPITQRELRDLREQTAKLHLDLVAGKHKNTSDARKLRRNIARALTLGIKQ